MTIQVWSWWRITIQGSTRYPMSIQIEYNGHAYCFGGRLLARSVGLSNITLVTEHIAFLLMTSSHGSGTCIISCLWFLTMVVWGCICIYIYIFDFYDYTCMFHRFIYILYRDFPSSIPAPSKPTDNFLHTGHISFQLIQAYSQKKSGT